MTMLYVLSSWGAALNCPTWARMAWQRWHSGPRPRARDHILAARCGIFLLSLGIVTLAGTRLAVAFAAGELVTVPNDLALVGIALMACAEPFFLYVDELHAKAALRRSFTWRIYWAGTISTVTLFAIALSTGVLV